MNIEHATNHDLLTELFVRAIKQTKAAAGAKWMDTSDDQRFAATLKTFNDLVDATMPGVIDGIVAASKPAPQAPDEQVSEGGLIIKQAIH